MELVTLNVLSSASSAHSYGQVAATLELASVGLGPESALDFVSAPALAEHEALLSIAVRPHGYNQIVAGSKLEIQLLRAYLQLRDLHEHVRLDIYEAAHKCIKGGDHGQ